MRKIERFSKQIPGFDPENPKHVSAVEEKVAKSAGSGFRIVNVDPSTSTVTFERGRSITQVTSEVGVPRKTVRLASGLKPSDGDREAARLEDQYPGFYMTRFEPFLQNATLEELTDELVRARGAVANALGVKPWDVQVSPRRGGGVNLKLPKSYMPSKHDEKLDEVATAVVGRVGWYVEVDTPSLTAQIIPADPPTFPETIPYPFTAKIPCMADGGDDWAKLPIGEMLPERASHTRHTLYLDLESSPHTAINGISGAGKAQPLDEVIPVPPCEKFPRGAARIGDLEPGDRVWNLWNRTSEITSLSAITDEEIYVVTLEDGRSTRCSPDHLWAVHVDAEPLPMGLGATAASTLAQCASAVDVRSAAEIAKAVGASDPTFQDALRGSLATIESPDGFPYGEAILWALSASQGVRRHVVQTVRLSAGDHLPDGSVVQSVRRTGETTPMRCLMVDHPSHIYLTAEGIPTHNTVTINAAIFGALMRGMQLAIADVPAKKVDFLWAKEFCAPGYWGCDSLEASVTTAGLIYDEGLERASFLERKKVQKWTELAAKDRFDPIFFVVDELTGLLMLETVPKLPKDDPIRLEAEEINFKKEQLKRFLKRTAAELRFVGVKLALSTQVASTNTGITTDLRMNLGNKMLLGAKPTNGNRRLALNDPLMVPQVPDNVANDRKVSRGVGVFEFEGLVPGVFKSFYGATEDYRAILEKVGAPTCDSPAPTQAQIAEYTIGGDSGGEPPERLKHDVDPWNGRLAPKAAEDYVYGEDGRPLKGAAAAARAAKMHGA